ncbi:MAG: iron-containing alcohol dehydrogenase family protein [Candidatus Limnocylindrales bacterium]
MLADRTIDLVLRDTVRFGVGAVERLPALVAASGASRAFIVTDAGVVAAGVADRVRAALASGGIEIGLFDGVEPDPGTDTVERGAAAFRRFGTDGAVVVPVGGGSAMDTAKAVSLLAVNDGGIWDLGYDDPALEPGRPLVAVPTTAGTGAETNSFGVITDDAVGRKGYVGHPSLLPVACVLDPALTLGLPPAPTAATGIDAMTHALESLLSRNPNPFAEAIALAVIRTVGEWLPRAVADGSDLEARSRLLFAAHLAGVGQASGTGVGLVHALGHSIGARGHLPHGTALAAVLPAVLAFDLPVRARELALVGVTLGAVAPNASAEDGAVAAVDAVRRLIDAVGQRRTLHDLGIGDEVHPTIVRDALDDPAIANTPRMPTADEVAAILGLVAG